MYYEKSNLRCCAPGCPGFRRAPGSNKNKSFFRFPRDPYRLQKWLKFCGLENQFRLHCEIKDHYRVCVDHFEKNQYYTGQIVRLITTAVPTLHAKIQDHTPKILKPRLKSPVAAKLTQSLSPVNKSLLKPSACEEKLAQIGPKVYKPQISKASLKNGLSKQSACQDKLVVPPIEPKGDRQQISKPPVAAEPTFPPSPVDKNLSKQPTDKDKLAVTPIEIKSHGPQKPLVAAAATQPPPSASSVDNSKSQRSVPVKYDTLNRNIYSWPVLEMTKKPHTYCGCSAPGCTNVSKANGPRKSFFCFPKEPMSMPSTLPSFSPEVQHKALRTYGKRARPSLPEEDEPIQPPSPMSSVDSSSTSRSADNDLPSETLLSNSVTLSTEELNFKVENETNNLGGGTEISFGEEGLTGNIKEEPEEYEEFPSNYKGSSYEMDPLLCSSSSLKTESLNLVDIKKEPEEFEFVEFNLDGDAKFKAEPHIYSSLSENEFTDDEF